MKNLSLSICLVVAALFGSVGMGSALPDCPKTDFPHNCFDKYIWDDGTKYVGDWQNGTFSGQGTMTYPNGDRYVGHWENGKKHGIGSYSYANGSKCFGEYQNDLIHGKAKCTFADGEVLEGIWKDHKFLSSQKVSDSNLSPKLKTLKKTNTKISVLQKNFKELSKNQRLQVQSNLKDSGFYKSSIDGLYGSGTKKALEAYNREHLGGSDLTKTVNAEILLLGLLDASPPSETFNPNQPAASCKTNASICSEQQVCSFASNGGVDEKKWNASWPEHIEEAKKRGLNCGLPVENKLSGKSLVKAIQTELNRIGCKAGYPDGVIGLASKRALTIFNKVNTSDYGARDFFTKGFLSKYTMTEHLLHYYMLTGFFVLLFALYKKYIEIIYKSLEKYFSSTRVK